MRKIVEVKISVLLPTLVSIRLDVDSENPKDFKILNGTVVSGQENKSAETLEYQCNDFNFAEMAELASKLV